MDTITIRPFTPQDRFALRQLCCDVADRGDVIENFFPDRDIAGDLLTKYYTDFEPQASFIAFADGRLVAYINGCMDNRRYGLVMFWLIMPGLLLKAFKRGLFFKKDVQSLIKGSLRNWRRLFSWRKKSFHSHLGHLHIGIAAGFRGQKIGEKLLCALVAYAKSQGVSVLAASVHDANKSAGIFFEKNGFTISERNPMVLVRAGRVEHYQSLIYVKKIG